MSNFTKENFPSAHWMSATKELDNLTLREMTLPGTHNAGCDWGATFPLIPSANWLACQDKSFLSQLQRGARALDLRLLYDNNADEFKKFRFQHNNYRSSRNLSHLIRDLHDFIGSSPDEFIILDFHELAAGDSAFNHEEFKALMLRHLGKRMIPENNRHLTLGELKAASPIQRILVAAPMTWDTRDDKFHQQISHKWIGQSLVSTTSLYRYITDVLSTGVSAWQPWSLSATSFTIGGPARILGELDNWFDPAKTDWAKKCSIINFDFIKDSNIVRFCQIASLQKAIEKSAVAPRSQAIRRA